MTPLPKIDGLIDYPFSNEKSYLMDIWLIENCDFYIGHNSGPIDVAYLFQKPVLIPNVTEFVMGNPRGFGDLCILKHVFSRKENRYLSVKELVELYLMNDTKPYHNPDLSFIENTPDELVNLVHEFVTVKLQSKETTKISDLQRTVLHRRFDLTKSVVWEPTLSEHNRSRFICRLLGYSGLIANCYLEKNYVCDSMNQSQLIN